MKKITNLICEKYKLILIVFFLLSLFSIFLMGKVKINYDLSEYLPKTSETRVGNDIMNAEFETLKSSSLSIMFEDVSNKSEILSYLKGVDGVSSVDYDDTSDYNKDNYTLFIVNVDDASDSNVAKQVYKEITHHFIGSNIYLDGDINNSNRVVLSNWIVALSIVIAVVILLIMSDNWVEPFLIMYTIGIAVFLNKGSNIIFKHVSNVTNSIVAILQMALSLDYSIILINRFKQEKKHFKNNVDAMKEALYKSVGSIVSSSLTTIVGLLVLVFMTFTLGRDLGLVLAKGVLLSLVSIFFCLPGLLLIFDKLMKKTSKKVFELKFNTLSKVIYKCRYLMLVIMIALFCVSYVFKGNLKFLYTEGEVSKIGEVFGENNQMAIIYSNQDEELLRNYCKELEDNDKINEVLCVGNTIDEELKYYELKGHVLKLGEDISDIDDYILKILYYNYYNKNTDNKMTFTEFIDFIENEIYTNDDFNEQVSKNKDSIERLKYFTYTDEINKPRNANELSEIFGISRENIDELLTYYISKNNAWVKLSLQEFLSFTNYQVMNSRYSLYLSANNKMQLNLLSQYTNNIDIKMNSEKLADYFGLDKSLVDSLYSYYVLCNGIDTKLSIAEFIDFTLNYALNDEKYSKYFDDSLVYNLKYLYKFTNNDYINKEVGSYELSETFNIDEDKVKELLYLYYSKYDSDDSYTLIELIQNLKYIKENTDYLDDIDYQSIIENSDFIKLSLNKENLYQYVDKKLVDAIYDAFGLDDNFELSIKDIINILSNYLDQETLEKYKEYIDGVFDLNKEIMDNLENYIDPEILNNINEYINKINNNSKKYNSRQLAQLLKVDVSVTNNIYALIKLVNGDTDDWVLSRLEFTEHLLNNKQYLDNDAIDKLELLLIVMNSSNNNTKYTYDALANVLNIDSSNLKNIYSLYTYNHNGLLLSPYEMVKFIISHQNDDLLKPYLNNDFISKLNLVNNIFDSVKDNTLYNYNDMSYLLDTDNNKLGLLYSLYQYQYNGISINIKDFTNFIVDDVLNSEFASSFSNDDKEKLITINGIVNNSIKNTKYSKDEMILILSKLSDDLDKKTIELLYIYFGSYNDYDENYTLTLKNLVNYLNDDILNNDLFDDFIDDEIKSEVINSKKKIDDAYNALVGKNYSRMVLITDYETENEETFTFVKNTRKDLSEAKETYLIGNSPMANDISETFNSEFNFVSILTTLSIFVVVALTFKSFMSPLIITLIIQSSVFTTMGILSFLNEPVSFIAILVVQSILMGATIDYGIVFTTYYLESRKKNSVKESIVKSYRKSSHTILTSGCILVVATFIVGIFASSVVSKICITISIGTTCSLILILFVLPGVMSTLDKVIVKKYVK